MIQSEYYGKKIDLTSGEAEMLLYLYLEVAKEMNFVPDAFLKEEILEDEAGYVFDTVAYHVEEFAKEKEGFYEIEHLFII